MIKISIINSAYIRTLVLYAVLCIAYCLPGLSYAAGGNPVALQKVYTGNVDYIATGKSLRDQPNGVDACSFATSSTVSISIPIGATILDAYLYYSGSGNNVGDTLNPAQIDLNDQTGLLLNGIPISTFAGFNDRNFSDLTELAPSFYSGLDFYGARRDVSHIVTGSGAYTLSGLTTFSSATRVTSQTCLGAWGLVIIYQDTTISNIRVINLFDGFAEYHETSLLLQPRNFVIDTGSPNGKMTHLSYEGDNSVAGAERFELEVGTSGLIEQTNGFNSAGQQFNDTVSGPDVFDTNTEYGLDLDTYDIAAVLSGQSNAFEATTRYQTGTDLVLLMMEIISVDNKDLADIEVTLSDVGLFQSSTSNASQYLIEVTNNGDGTANPSTGFATGFIHVYQDLPSGISLDSFGDITAPGWDCSATNLATNQVRCVYPLATLPGSQLAKGDNLPNISISIDIATPTSPVTSQAYVSLCSNNPDTCTTFDEKHTDATQFDPKNFFELPSDLFDLTSKSTENNNVDSEVSAIITGPPSDLSTSTKTVSDLNGGLISPADTLEYTITLTESSGTTATAVSISDVLDANLTNYAFQAGPTTCSFVTNSFTSNTLNMTGISVPASSSCDVVFRADINAFASAGTAIDNTAVITNGNGIDGQADAVTLLVAGSATGSKVLYLDQLSSTRDLSRTAPALDSSVTVATSNSTNITLNPTLAADIDINSGIIPISVWIEASSNGDYDVTAELRYDSAGSNTLVGSVSLNNVTMTSGTGNAQFFPFQINLASDILDLDLGEDIRLTLSNGGGSAGSIVIHSLLSGLESKLVVDAANVINVDNTTFYSDLARTLSVSTIEAGQIIYIEADVSDPFGAYDITAAELTLIDPNLATQLSSVVMTLDAGATTTSNKTFYYAYTTPPTSSIAAGTWSAQIEALEGNEATISHTEVSNFDVTAPNIEVSYTVNVNAASPLDSLSYTITIENDGLSSVLLDISQAVPVGTNGLTITSLPSGSSVLSTGTLLNIQNISAAPGTTTITFDVTVLGAAQPGDLIDHTISLDNSGDTITDVATTVLIDPFDTHAGNKPIYADNLSTSPILDRSIPVTNTTRVLTSQGGSTTLVLSPVLQGDLTLAAGNIEASIWVSRDPSFAGQRTVQATLAYAGVSTGTIASDTVTVTLESGLGGAQYLPFNFALGSATTVLANSALTLTISNDTAISGEDITLHSFKDGLHPTLVSLDAVTPLNITAIDVFNNDIDAGGTLIVGAAVGSTVWVRATVEDPFGSADITAAELTITDPLSAVTLSAATMTVPVTQPAPSNQRYFQASHVLSSEQGAWDLSVIAHEGSESLVSDTDNVSLAVAVQPDLTDSYKFVTSPGNPTLSGIAQGDTLHYTIELVELSGVPATSVSVDDVIPTNTSFVSGSLFVDGVVQTDPAPDINLTGLTVPASGSLTIEFDVLIDTPLLVGTVISNEADITNPSGIVTSITVNAQDVILSGPPASGLKRIYLENLDVSPFLTRLQPQTPLNTDRVVVNNAGGTLTLLLTPALSSAITLDPADGSINVNLQLRRQGNNNGNRSMTVQLDYIGAGIGSIGSVTQNANLTATITQHTFSILPAAIMTIPSGAQLRLTITNNQAANNRKLRVYSYNNAGTQIRSSIDMNPSPVINVDSISFWTDTMGAGTATTNPNPDGVPVDIYAKVVISDPFGDADIQAPDDAVNPTTVSMTNPDATVSLSGSVSCSAPCYAYDGEDIVNDPPGDGTRTFYYIVRLDAVPSATRGLWTMQVTANEGLETGEVSHTALDTFTTLSTPNLETSTKVITAVTDVDPGDPLSFIIVLNNTGGLDADNVTFSDTLQTSPVSLSFVSASTTCTDEVAAALPAPSFSGGIVSLANISVTGGGNCSITINTTVGAGSAGDLVDNIALITNPAGPGANPSIPTLLLSASTIPVAGNKQLYLDDFGGTGSSPTGTRILTRSEPLSIADTITLSGNDGRTVTFNLLSNTTREMVLDIGSVDINLLLRETGNGAQRLTEVELLVDANDGGGFVSIDTSSVNISLTGTAALKTLNLVNSAAITLNVGSSVRLVVTNQTTQNNRLLYVSQSTSAPFSEVVLPLLGSIEVTELKFYDRSATDETGSPGCSPSCGSEVLPAYVESGNTIWLRSIIADGFGAFDVNTGCDGVTATNCPTFVLVDPTSADQTPISPADELTFVTTPDTSSRQYEIELNPAGFGLEGVWVVDVFGKEGLEDAISDSSQTSFERFGAPILTVVKTVSGSTFPGSIVTYQNDITNTGAGPATNLVLDNLLAPFLALELVESGGNWTALFSITGGYTILGEAFDSGDNSFTYDPVPFCGVASPGSPPCYDPAISKWRVEITESLLPLGNILEQYKARVD